MDETCSLAPSQYPQRRLCPECHKIGRVLSLKTIKHHVQCPWQHHFIEQGYYFCHNPSCNVVYFGENGHTIEHSALRTPVGIKNPSEEASICYCFGVSRKEATNAQIKAYVVQQTKQKHCACNIRNPSGRCCLADFPKSALES